MDDSTNRLLVRVAQLYYLQDLNQEEIARRCNVSRSKVSRLLKEARDSGIVEIVIHPPAAFSLELERQLEAEFSLQEAVVVNGGVVVGNDVLGVVASAAADYLQRVLKPGDVLGVSAGQTIARIVQALPVRAYDNVSVVQVGSVGVRVGAPVAYSGRELASQLARKLGCLDRLTTFPVPSVFDSQAIRDAILADTGVKQALAQLENCTIALVGIGAFEPLSGIAGSLGITPDEMGELRAQGAAGEICTRFYDIHGIPCRTSLVKRHVGIDLEHLRSTPLVIGAACGSAKLAAILGALHGHYVKVLITDDATAIKLLALARPSTAAAEATA
ncbi:MAG: winged helix-turn-helix transcriptional regulator [Chloroflexota bacterium]|nr:winged helix-turn-helix transcriptional regulator [Chloroflexota bacterium]